MISPSLHTPPPSHTPTHPIGSVFLERPDYVFNSLRTFQKNPELRWEHSTPNVLMRMCGSSHTVTLGLIEPWWLWEERRPNSSVVYAFVKGYTCLMWGIRLSSVALTRVFHSSWNPAFSIDLWVPQWQGDVHMHSASKKDAEAIGWGPPLGLHVQIPA